MLIQETGLQRELTLDEIARRTPEQEAMLFERKFAMSFVGGSGAIEWLWNSNSYMTESNETPIGALHADGTEKPEATVLRDMAKFAAAASPYLVNPKQPVIAIVTSQAAQYSVQADLQIAAQQNAVRALGYDLHQPCYIIAENQIDKLGSPKLVILPSAQALRESTWQALLAYVSNGGNLLVTGPVSRDEHWHLVDRYTPLGIKAATEPLTFHYASTENQGHPLSYSFAQDRQQLLEYLALENNALTKEVSLGTGKLILFAYPIELTEGTTPAAHEYESILQRLSIAAPFTAAAAMPAGVLVYPVELQDSLLYVLESESDRDADLDIKDSATGSSIKFRLLSQRAALAVVDKKSKQIVAKYGLP